MQPKKTTLKAKRASQKIRSRACGGEAPHRAHTWECWTKGSVERFRCSGRKTWKKADTGLAVVHREWVDEEAIKAADEALARHRNGGKEPRRPIIPATNQIGLYLHCGVCLNERPAHTSPRDWAQLEVGWTKQGLQVWCKRHNCNVLHVDFEGCKHPANVNREKFPWEKEARQ